MIHFWRSQNYNVVNILPQFFSMCPVKVNTFISSKLLWYKPHCLKKIFFHAIILVSIIVMDLRFVRGNRSWKKIVCVLVVIMSYTTQLGRPVSSIFYLKVRQGHKLFWHFFLGGDDCGRCTYLHFPKSAYHT